MRRRSVLAIALAGLTALLGSCGGGGEDVSLLAVAFRLDEGSPVMSAYVGDPSKDMFQLSAGRYYVEALDQKDVVVSLGAVDVGSGETVDLPASLEGAGGIADPARAEALKTLASFLVDADLAEYAFLEIVSGGFEQPLFDPGVEVTAADVERLFGMYDEILAQKDSVLAAFREIQEGAEVSGHSPSVSSRWGQDGEELDQPFFRVRTLFDALPQDWEEKERAQQEAEAALARETHWVMTWNRDLRTGVLRPGFAVEKTLELEEKHREWEHYAEYLVERLPSNGDEAALAQAQKELTDAIKSDFEAWLKEGSAGLPAGTVDVFANYFVAETFAAAGHPVTVPTPPPGFWGASTPAVPTPDTGWIESYVQAVGEQWVDEGYGAEAVVAAENLRVCLTAAAEAGASRDEAIAKCPTKSFKPQATPEATETPAPTPEPTETPVAEETETPAVEETETPAPEPTQTPTPEPTETPAPPAQSVTARGGFDVDPNYFSIAVNTMTLTFSPGGGSVIGDSRLHYEGSACPDTTDWWDETAHFEGTYIPDSKTFTGTATWTYENSLWSLEGDPATCVEKHTGDSVTIDWYATLEGGVVTGSLSSREFQLTVQ